MRTSMKTLVMAAALALFVQVALGEDMPSYKCSLKPHAGVTGVKTTGSVEMYMTENNSMIKTVVYLKGIKGMVNAHFHVGAEGQNGGVAVPAFQGSIPPFSGDFRFRLDFNASALDMAVLDNMGYYFNVHTKAYPAGEVRCNPKKV